jgi:hypothetical protein
MATQLEAAHRSEVASKEEHIGRLLTEMRLLDERLTQYQLQVGVVHCNTNNGAVCAEIHVSYAYILIFSCTCTLSVCV